MLLPPPLATFLPRATARVPSPQRFAPASLVRGALGVGRGRLALSPGASFLVINLVATALFCAAWLKGWVAMILAGDSTHQVVLIAAVFAYGLVRCGGKIFITSAELNQTRELPLGSAHRGCRDISRASRGTTPSRGRSAPRRSR